MRRITMEWRRSYGQRYETTWFNDWRLKVQIGRHDGIGKPIDILWDSHRASQGLGNEKKLKEWKEEDRTRR